MCYSEQPVCRVDLTSTPPAPLLSVKVLADIELAQTLKSETEKSQEEIETVPHPLDQDYNSIKCVLRLMDKKSESFKVSAARGEVRLVECEAPVTTPSLLCPRMQVIQTYMKMTSETYRKQRILNVWEVDRELEVM